nr:unnamed protein product [Callosobruchus analis]
MDTRSVLILMVVLCAVVSGAFGAGRYVPKWKKQACEIPSSQTEHSHYICTDDGEVKCLAGWTGDLCDVPKCRPGCDPLQGYCNRPGECLCKLGYYGDRCNRCIPLPGCQHGYCNESFQCICQEGWDGLFCSEPICHSDCQPARGYCEAPGECRCRLGWAGRNCRECQVLPGCVHGYCDKPLECKCRPGYTGLLCQIPICSPSCHKERGYCRKPGECRCKVGWWGKNCEKCFPYPGCVHGTCRRPWECNCQKGWGGMLCDEEMSYCENNPDTCKNNAKCISTPKDEGNFRCLCREGTSGRHCEHSDLQTMRPYITSAPTSPSNTTESLLVGASTVSIDRENKSTTTLKPTTEVAEEKPSDNET